MDVDDTHTTRNSPFIHYFDVSSSFPWQEPRPEQIRLRRALMDGTLIFDILLTAGEVGDPYILYPPDNPEALQRLLDAIELSNYDTLKRDCLIYFLLKWHQDGREKTFQEQRCIPPQFVSLADAYWHLDTGFNVPRAVAILSDARLNRDYTSKILRAISLSPESAPLIRRYIQTAKPLLVEPLDLECYTLALADLGVMEAWQFVRTFSEQDPTRTRLLQKMFEWTISPQPRPIALRQLLTLPLSRFEERILNEFVQKPPIILPFSSIATLQDLICVRLIQGGRYTEAIKFDKLLTSTTPQKHLKDTHDRSNMVQDIYNALPAVEKALLDLELDPTVPPQRPLLSKSQNNRPSTGSENQDTLTQSWVEVRVPDTLVPKSTPLRDVRIPPATPTLRPSTTGAPPMFPIHLNGVNGGIATTTPNKGFPLAASLSSSVNPQLPLTGVAARLNTPNATASPARGIKLPRPSVGSSHGPDPVFVSASRQQNAFYRPPIKSNGVKRAFEDEPPQSPDLNYTPMEEKSAELDVEMERVGDDAVEIQGRKSPSVDDSDDENVLQYSVFESTGESSRRKVDADRRPANQKTQPGAFESDDIKDDQGQASPKQSGRTRRGRATRPTQKVVEAKPPAKKKKYTKEKGVRSIPGGLMEDDDDEPNEDDEDQIAPLPVRISRSNRSSGGKRKSFSADTTDEMEGIQTRRRSSRLSAAGSSASMRGVSPEPLPRPKRTGRSSTSGKKKR